MNLLERLRLRLWVAAALPAMLAIVLLLTQFLVQHGTQMRQAMLERGRAASSQLAGAAAFALFAGNSRELQRLVDTTISGDAQLKAVAILDPLGLPRTLAGQLTRPLPTPTGRELSHLGEGLVVMQPIRAIVRQDEELFFENQSLVEAEGNGEVIGYAMLEYSLASIESDRRVLLAWSVGTTLGGLLLAGLLSTLMVSRVAVPLAEISETVSRISVGELDARADPRHAGLLAPLALDINQMADRIAMTQEELRSQVALATTELREQKEQAERQARVDALTGVSSRQAFTEMAQAEIQRALRYRLPLSLVMVDLDHFKRVNDTFGHASGDAVLRDFAATVREQLRDIDIIGRLGGEEFVVLLPSVPASGALHVAERMRTALMRRSVSAHYAAISYTASFGVAEFNAADGTLEHLLARADAALYQAKHQGRNRVELADASTRPPATGT